MFNKKTEVTDVLYSKETSEEWIQIYLSIQESEGPWLSLILRFDDLN